MPEKTNNQMIASHAEMIAEAEAKLATAEIKLSEIERLKKMESSVRNEIASLTEQLRQMKCEKKFYGNQVPLAKGSQIQEDEASSSPKAVAPAFKTPLDLFKTEPQSQEDMRKKRLKALSKKLRQIDDLKKKPYEELDLDGKEKLSSEKKVREEIAALERGEDFEVEDEENMILPTDAGERDKLLKGLKKKLQQIDALKAKDGPLDADAKAKVDGEYRILQQVEALERGDFKVVFTAEPEPDMAEILMKEKVEANRKLKVVTKKLEMIQKLRECGRPLDDTEREKIAGEKELKQEKGAIERVIGDINKRDQERMAARLGWKDDGKKKKNKK